MPDGMIADHQTEKPRTSRASKPPALHAGIPSIETLARFRLACRDAGDALRMERHKDATNAVARKFSSDAEDLLLDRDIYLRDLLTTVQARTLGDALVQIALVQEVLDPHLDLSVKDDALDLDDLKTLLLDVKKVFRLATSVFSVIAAVNGGNPTELVDIFHIDLSERYFSPIGRIMGEAA